MRSWFFSTCLLVGIGFFVSSCNEVRTENGRVPKKYESQVDPVVGVFSGNTHLQSSESLEPHPEDEVLLSELEIRWGEENRLVAEGLTDLVGQECESRIGELHSIILDKDNQIMALIFNFDPGYCRSEVRGHQLRLYFNANNSFDVVELSIDHSTRVIEEGPIKRRVDYARKGKLKRKNLEEEK